MNVRIFGAMIVAATTLAAADAVLRIEAVPDSKIVRKVQPEYTAEAREAHIQGVVRVRVFIGTDGHVQEARLVSGHPLLAPAALQAARQWSFKPFEQDGKPARAVTNLEFSFPPAANNQ